MKIALILIACFHYVNCHSQNNNIDESILKEKSQQLLKDFEAESKLTSSDYNTLIDLNYDDIKDL